MIHHRAFSLFQQTVKASQAVSGLRRCLSAILPTLIPHSSVAHTHVQHLHLSDVQKREGSSSS